MRKTIKHRHFPVAFDGLRLLKAFVLVSLYTKCCDMTFSVSIKFFIAAAGQDPYVKTAILPDAALQSSRECASAAIPKVNGEVEDRELRRAGQI